MNTVNRAGLVMLLAVLIGLGSAVSASAQGCGTLWEFLGIPQGIHKGIDATINKKGNFPGCERKPPLKRLADPANLESDDPAIKAAAEIKKEEDLAPQKIKAIKYLAEVGCGCPSRKGKVQNALLAALDDCTEEVRYEAAIAFCEASGNPCTQCSSSCCSAEVMNKLNEMANGKDENGCWLESSPRVRAAAQNALNACRRRHRPTTEPTEGGPIEGPGPLERREDAVPTPAPAPAEIQTRTIPRSPTPTIQQPTLTPITGHAPVFVHPAAYTRTVGEVSGNGLAWPRASTPEARFQGAIIAPIRQ